MRTKTTLLLSLIMAFGFGAIAQPHQTATPRVIVYYFHPTERCPIDQAIEENTRATFQSYFVDAVKSGKVKLLIVNTDDKVNEKLMANFDINSQALYLVNNSSGKPVQTDLTTFAFDYGKSNPSKFKMKLKEYIEEALK